MEIKSFKAQVKEFNDQNLTVTHFISTEEQDRSGDIMRADGMKMRGVPAVLKEHGFDTVQGREPIAKPISITIGTDSKGFKGILVKTQYYDGSHLSPPDNTGRRLYEKARDGFMDKWSVGFMVEDARPIAGGGRDVKSWEILEYSQVGVPDNVGATTQKYQLDVKMVQQSPDAVEGPIVNLKSIAERVKTEIPYRALMSITDAFFYELYNIESEKEVSALLKEFTEMAKPYCVAMVDAMNAYSEKSSPEELAEYKSKYRIVVKSDVVDSDQPPADVEPPEQEAVPSGDTPAAAIAQPVSSAAETEDDGMVSDAEDLAFVDFNLDESADEGVDLPVDAAGLAKMVSDATSLAFKAELGKLTGKIS
jgi:hypothetical protein